MNHVTIKEITALPGAYGVRKPLSKLKFHVPKSCIMFCLCGYLRSINSLAAFIVPLFVFYVFYVLKGAYVCFEVSFVNCKESICFLPLSPAHQCDYTTLGVTIPYTCFYVCLFIQLFKITVKKLSTVGVTYVKPSCQVFLLYYCIFYFFCFLILFFLFNLYFPRNVPLRYIISSSKESWSRALLLPIAKK